MPKFLIAPVLRATFPLRTKPKLVYQTADGETVPTKVWAVGRADSRGIKFEVVSSSRPGTNPIGHRWARPIAAMPTEAPQRTVVQVDIPATDEVGASNKTKGEVWSSYQKSIFDNLNPIG